MADIDLATNVNTDANLSVSHMHDDVAVPMVPDGEPEHTQTFDGISKSVSDYATVLRCPQCGTLVRAGLITTVNVRLTGDENTQIRYTQTG